MDTAEKISTDRRSDTKVYVDPIDPREVFEGLRDNNLSLYDFTNIDASSREERDETLIHRYCGDDFRWFNGSILTYQSTTGLWCITNPRKIDGECRSKVRSWLRSAREQAFNDALIEIAEHNERAPELSISLDDYKSVQEPLITAYTQRYGEGLTKLFFEGLLDDKKRKVLGVKEVTTIEINQIEYPSIRPLTDGRAYDFDSGLYMKPEQLKYKYIIDNGWEIQPPLTPQEALAEISKNSPSDAERVVEIMAHYGEDYVSMMAIAVKRTGKSVQLFVRPKPNWGKTTAMDSLKRALGEKALGRLNAYDVLNASRFDQVGAKLSEHLILVLDELDKAKEVRPSVITNSSAETVSPERKFMDVMELPRVGTLVLMGSELPVIDTSIQGIKERLNLVSFKSEVDKVDFEFTNDDRNMMRNRGGWRFMWALIAKRAVELKGSVDDMITQAEKIEGSTLQEDREAFFEETLSETAQYLRDNYDYNPLKTDQTIPIQDLVARVNKNVPGADVKASRTFVRFLNEAFPGIQRKVLRSGQGNRQTYAIGLIAIDTSGEEFKRQFRYSKEA